MRKACRRFCLLISAAAVWCTAPVAKADGLAALEAFIKTTQSAQTSFVQTVTQPGREGRAGRIKVSRGEFSFLRPNRFKFVYTQPFAQIIQADGQTLWLYDLDLKQVTARPLQRVLSGSPAALFASAQSLQVLQAQFKLQAEPPPAKATETASMLEWVTATPRSSAADAGNSANLMQSIRIGFRRTDKGVEIAALALSDSFGQHSLIEFSKVTINTGLRAADFVFTPPSGVPVLRQ